MMPNSFTQLFAHGRNNETPRQKPDQKSLLRRQSTGALQRQKKDEKIKLENQEVPSTRKYSNVGPAAKRLAGYRQRSHTVDNLTAKARLNKLHSRENIVKPPIHPHNSQIPSEDKKRGFSWIISARRSRSHSTIVFPDKRKSSEPLPSSTLVTASNYRNLVHMSQSTSSRTADHVNHRNSTSADGSGSRDDDYQPASVENFVRKCADCFDESGNCINTDFLRAFFLSHLWFMTSEQLMVLFSQLYQEEEASEQHRRKIFFAIRFWLKNFPHMFDLDSKLVEALKELQSLSSTDSKVDISTIDLSNRDSYQWMSESNVSVRPHQVNRKQRKVSLVFNHLEPEDIAIHISFLEYKSFRRLTLSDFHSYVVNGVIKNNLKLERAIVVFNNITQWVQCMILDHLKPQERAQAITKFIEIAKKLYKMRNFNTLMAVVGALTHTAISRLKKTMAMVPKDSLKALDEFIELLDSKSNYNSYRKTYGQVAESFKIPIIGILMKDLISLHAALPDRIGDGLINVRKMMMIGGMFQELIRLQTSEFPYEINRDLLNTLRVSLYLFYSEDEVYQLSFKREPRESKTSVSTSTSSSPSKMVNIGFAEFTSFTCQLDEDTIRQHVTGMVTSVYKAYDENSDGFICEAEFERFTKNFPGIDPFAVVDKDGDGKISCEEMIDYFMKISTTRRNQICQGFKHDFVETTYFQPTFCENCKKLLWGLVKQGWRCKGCGINCHKHCKDRIVQECRVKSNNKQALNNTPVTKKKKEKPKLSTSSGSDFSTNGDTARVSTVDDDAFAANDSKYRPRLANLTRPASFNAADIRSGSFPAKDYKKSTESPTRKQSTSTLNYEVGKKTIQRKVQKMLKKRISSKNCIPQNDKLPDAGDKRKQLRRLSFEEASYSNRMNHPRNRKSGDNSETHENRLSSAFESPKTNEPRIVSRTSTPLTSSSTIHHNANFMTIDDLQPLNERRDSGLSSCSCLTSTSVSTSAPATPSNQEQVGGCLRFQYPNSTPSLKTTSDKHSPEAFATITKESLIEENHKLRNENVKLQNRLSQAEDAIKDLESKLHTVKQFL